MNYLVSPESLLADSIHSGCAGPHVLVVDDRIAELRLLIELIRHEGYRISVAFDGSQAYERAQALMPDLIVMDVQMPNLGGIGACRLIQSNPATAHMPILFLSAAADLRDRLEGLRSGGVDYIVKPYEPEEVLARINVHLRRQGLLDPSVRSPLLSGSAQHDHTLVLAACKYLRTRLSNPPGIKQLAQVVNTNEKRLSKAFNSQLGMTVFEFVRYARLEEAVRMLRSTSLSITQISEVLGYSSSANFATAFRQRFDQKPSEFRESCAKQADSE